MEVSANPQQEEEEEAQFLVGFSPLFSPLSLPLPPHTHTTTTTAKKKAGGLFFFLCHSVGTGSAGLYRAQEARHWAAALAGRAGV